MMVDNTAQRAARTEADRAMAVLDATTDYVAILDADGRLAWANQATALLLGDGLGDSSRDPFDLLDAPSRYIFAAEALPEVERSGIWRGEVELDLGHGFTVPVSMLVIGHRDEQTGAVDHVALVARDISDVKRSQERLTHLATHDPLTGLPNRALCMDRLRHALDRTQLAGLGDGDHQFDPFCPPGLGKPCRIGQGHLRRNQRDIQRIHAEIPDRHGPV